MVRTMRMGGTGLPHLGVFVLIVILLLLAQPVITQMSNTNFQTSGELKTTYPGSNNAEWKLSWTPIGVNGCHIDLTVWIFGAATNHNYQKDSQEPCSKEMLEEFLGGLIKRFNFAENLKASFEALLALVRAL